ncbi:DUF3616 domain-containing protein [Pseudonocardia sp. Cha107L01]|uniref:DUF3616 domain-containing protein n=1 Tax=Pseudonocardia sp. Cha107L01 TaxID=3457576 RepID=UPI00403E66A9
MEIELRDRPACRAGRSRRAPGAGQEHRRRPHQRVVRRRGEPNLANLLAEDEHLAPFLAIPAKDNGFDVEGLAVHGETLYVGLRGPVLRGFAVVLELLPEEAAPGRLRLVPIEGERCYRKHFLDLGGLGVRDLCPHGPDL